MLNDCSYILMLFLISRLKDKSYKLDNSNTIVWI